MEKVISYKWPVCKLSEVLELALLFDVQVNGK